MKTTSARAVVAIALGMALVATAGCVRVKLPEAEYESKHETVEAGSATEVQAAIDMGAGELTITGGASALMDADFDYTKASWRPEVDYTVDAGKGRLSVRQPSKLDLTPFANMRYAWTIALTDDLPLDLAVNMGAGEADLDLRGTDLRRLKMNLGAGDTMIDLSGAWLHDLDADITAGAGALELRVPADVGVRVIGFKDGLGTYEADGFKQDGDALVNDAYEDADVRFDITLRRGVGDVTIETID